MKALWNLSILTLFLACGNQDPIVGQWQMESNDGNADSSDITGGMGNLVGGMRVFTFKEDGTGSVRLGTANEPFNWQIEGDTLTRTAKKTTAILKQRVMKSTYRIEGDKLILTEYGKEIILRRK